MASLVWGPAGKQGRHDYDDEAADAAPVAVGVEDPSASLSLNLRALTLSVGQQAEALRRHVQAAFNRPVLGSSRGSARTHGIEGGDGVEALCGLVGLGARPPPITSRAEAFSWFEDERINLLATAHQVADDPASLPEFIPRVAEVMYWFFLVRSYWRDAEELNQLVLRVARQRGDRHGQAVALNDLGYTYAASGRLDWAT